MKFAFGLVALMIAGSVMAAPKSSTPKPWPQEPQSFLGISFGQKIEGVVAPCPPGYQDITQICHEPRYGDGYTIKGLPDLGLRYRPQLMAKAGADGVESFYLQTKSEDFSDLVELFKAKYGSPTDQQTEKVKTKGGGEFLNRTMNWRGKQVMIRLVQYSGDIDTSSATIIKNTSLEKLMQSGDDKTRAAASKL